MKQQYNEEQKQEHDKDMNLAESGHGLAFINVLAIRPQTGVPAQSPVLCTASPGGRKDTLSQHHKVVQEDIGAGSGGMGSGGAG